MHNTLDTRQIDYIGVIDFCTEVSIFWTCSVIRESGDDFARWSRDKNEE